MRVQFVICEYPNATFMSAIGYSRAVFVDLGSMADLCCKDSEGSHSHSQGVPYTVGTIAAERGKFTDDIFTSKFQNVPAFEIRARPKWTVSSTSIKREEEIYV